MRRLLAADLSLGFAISGGSPYSHAFCEPSATTTDTSGNFYATGKFEGVVDFDPGASVFELTSRDHFSVYVAKYGADGLLVWAKQFAGSSEVTSTAIQVDANGNVFTSGAFRGDTDFDPGAGIALHHADSYVDHTYLAKLDSAGDFVFAKSISSAEITDIAVDLAGDLYTTGYFLASADFDPGTATANLTAHSDYDGFIAKYDNAGDYQFVKQLRGNSKTSPTAIAVDSVGNIVVAGSFTGGVDFDPGPSNFTLTTEQYANDTFFAEYGSTGDLHFAKNISGRQTNAAAVEIDASNNIYITGNFIQTVDFDPGSAVHSLTSAGAYDAYVAKYDAQGNYVFARGFGGTGFDAGRDIKLDQSGNIYTTGYFEEKADFDPSSEVANLVATGLQDVFLAKFDSSGNYLFAKQLGGAGLDNAASLAINNRGQVNVCGSFRAKGDFDPGEGVVSLNNFNTAQAIFFVNLDASGNYLGAFSLTSARFGPDRAYGIATDASGNTYVVGEFAGTADFDPTSATANLSSLSTQSGFVAKYSPAGLLLWVTPISGDGDVAATAVAVDVAGNVYATGKFFGTLTLNSGAAFQSIASHGDTDAFVVKYDNNGTLIYVNRFGSDGSDSGTGIAIDTIGNAYVSGSFEGSISFDPALGVAPLTSAGGVDALVMKLAADGRLAFAKSLGGDSDDRAAGIVIDSSANIYITGTFQDVADFDPGEGVSDLSSAGAEDAFVAKLSATGSLVFARGFGGSDRDLAKAVAVDTLRNVYITGAFYGTADFDPGAGTALLSSPNPSGSAYLSTAFISKLDASGSYLFARKYDGDGYYSVSANSIAVDTNQNIYTTGKYVGLVDFDPGSGVANLQRTYGDQDVFISKLDRFGNYLAAARLGGAAYEQGQGIALDSVGNCYVAGAFSSTEADFDPGPGVYTLASVGNAPFSSDDFFVVKLTPPHANTPTVSPATTDEDATTTNGLVVSRNPADGDEVTHFKVTNIVGGSLFLADGTTLVFSGSFISYQNAHAGLRFTPNPNRNDSVGPSGFTVQASIRANNSGLGGGLAAVSVTVNAVNDVAFIITPSQVSVTEDGPRMSYGKVVIYDNDVGENNFKEAAAASLVGRYGQFSFNAANGNWSYALNYQSADVQTLAVGTTVFDSLRVESHDGTSYTFLNVSISGTNDAPRLDASKSPVLTAIDEDNRTSYGTPVWVLLGGVSDVDAGAARGLALTAASGAAHGTWQYTLDGGASWLSVGAVSGTSAKLLPANGNLSRIRFAPNQDFNGSVVVGFFAWDQTSGVAGGTADVSQAASRGGITAFSNAFDTATLAIKPVNDPPRITLPTTTVGYALNTSPVLLASTGTMKDVDTLSFSGGWLTVQISKSADANDRLTIGGAFKVVDGNVIWNNSVSIGSLTSSGQGAAPLTIVFNAEATPYRIEQLVRSIKFGTAAGSTKTGVRTIGFTMNDGVNTGNTAKVNVQVS